MGAEYVAGVQEPGGTTGDDTFHELPNATEQADRTTAAWVGLVLSFL